MAIPGMGGARPLVAVEGPPGAQDRAVQAAIAIVQRDGWHVVRGWGAPLGGERIVCLGAVRTADDGRRALLAGVAGSGLVVALLADRETKDRFLDDLRRLGPVDHVIAPDGQIRLTDGQRALLALVADGLTVREAAAELGLSPRTAYRRLAAARSALGVESTAAAIVALLAHGR